MFRKTHLAAALAAAALGVAAMASPAPAQPIDNFTLESDNGKFAFAGGCGAGAGAGVLDWNNNQNNTSAELEVDGRLCLRNTTADARLHVVYHALGGAQITHFHTPTVSGSGGALDAFSTNAQGDRISYDTLDHAHIYLERDSGSGWQVADSVVEYP
jgi:hypothetical protein